MLRLGPILTLLPFFGDGLGRGQPSSLVLLTMVGFVVLYERGRIYAAACALAARDAGLPLSFQLLIYPGTCAHQDTASHFAYADGYLLGRETILWFFDQYIGTPADRDDWRFAPLNAPTLAGLAPAWVGLAEFDALVDEGVDYARKLQAAGVPTELRLYAGMVHTFFNMGGFVRAATRAHDDAVAALRRIWGLD